MSTKMRCAVFMAVNLPRTKGERDYPEFTSPFSPPAQGLLSISNGETLVFYFSLLVSEVRGTHSLFYSNLSLTGQETTAGPSYTCRDAKWAPRKPWLACSPEPIPVLTPDPKVWTARVVKPHPAWPRRVPRCSHLPSHVSVRGFTAGGDSDENDFSRVIFKLFPNPARL